MTQFPYLLHIETATEICSVAISQGLHILSCKESQTDNAHAQNLLSYVDEALKETQLSLNRISAIAIGIGPGSFTGLRIGVSAAKGLAYSLEIPVIAVSTLQTIMMGAKQEIPSMANAFPLRFAPMIDARRMEVYTSLFEDNGNRIREIETQILDEDTYIELLENQNIVFCGNGSVKAKKLYEAHPHAFFSEVPLSAKNMAKSALLKFQEQSFENLAYFEPFYLKDYVATKSIVKGLR